MKARNRRDSVLLEGAISEVGISRKRFFSLIGVSAANAPWPGLGP